jgi:hypothetical protein
VAGLCLDTSDWLATHPGDAFTVCLNGGCRPTTTSPTGLFTPMPVDPPRT